ncbi:hypothetical protein Q2T40_15165 [Winogradskyella maritima]|uniref:Uncharacterized protein n=1 Tax=Winogradskyella maritima TaxID=1517766 RepID=A0ABV8AG77_9FLAO|nr:hypothetical protein [Winogradskyella maritima]
MGFGGSAQAMITAIKNNEKMRRAKRERFKSLGKGDYKGFSKKTEYDLPQASEKQLHAIRKRMQRERKFWWIKVSVLTLIGFLALVTAILILT